MSRRIGAVLLALALAGAALAPWLSTGEVSTQHPAFPLAPPQWPAVHAADGHWHRPFVPRRTLLTRLPPTYRVSNDPLPLAWFDDRLVRSALAAEPWLPLGSDTLGRDVWTRLLHGARLSLGLALSGLAGATVLGTLIGLVAGARGGWADTILMRGADLFLAWPALYVVLVLRARLPLVLPFWTLFALMAAVLTLAGWPVVARGVRGVVAADRQREYILAVEAAGASMPWLMRRHLLPAAAPVLATQVVLLLPAFVLAEATLSFVGLGFAEPTPSWGTMLREASTAYTVRQAPWLLAPAVAIAVVTLAANLLVQRRDHADSEPSPRQAPSR